MDNALFRKLQDAIEKPCRSKEWFGMAEQAINTVYALGERPDVLCDSLIKNLTRRAFDQQPRAKTPQPSNSGTVDAEESREDTEETSVQSQPDEEKDTGDAWTLSQLLFVVGHVAVKHIVYLELVEREWKRQKHEKELGATSPSRKPGSTYSFGNLAEKLAERNSPRRSKDQEELDQVAGNAEDEIGDRIAAIREIELLYSPDSLLSIYGPMVVHICGSPHKFKVHLHIPSNITS